MTLRAFSMSLILSLSGCGAAYVPSTVRTDEAGQPVNVVMLTAQTVQQANAETRYTPRSIPAAFSSVAGGGTARARAVVLPESPLSNEPRPGSGILRAPPAFTPGPYRIGVGDVVVLATPAAGRTVQELSGLTASQNLRQGYTVQDDDTITVPDVGRIKIGGLTVSEAEDLVFDRLVQNQIEPAFNLEVREFNARRVTVGGAVRTAQVVPVTLGPLYLNEALSAAGGISLEDRQWALIRMYRDGTLYEIPLPDFDRRTDLQRLPLKDGDSIFVDTEYRLDRAQAYFEQQIRLAEVRASRQRDALSQLNSELAIRRSQQDEARSNFQARLDMGAVARDYVYVTGEVTEPSRFTLPFGKTAVLADALMNAGGVAPSTGNPSQIYVLRQSPGGQPLTAWRLDASNAVNLVHATRFELRPADVIFVAEQPITTWNRLVQQIVPSLIVSGVSAAAAAN